MFIPLVCTEWEVGARWGLERPLKFLFSRDTNPLENLDQVQILDGKSEVGAEEFILSQAGAVCSQQRFQSKTLDLTVQFSSHYSNQRPFKFHFLSCTSSVR